MDSRGYADLLDYLTCFDECGNADDDFVETAYEQLLAAVDEASPEECGALFHKLCRLEYEPNEPPPRPSEERLPVADRLWAIILPNLADRR